MITLKNNDIRLTLDEEAGACLFALEINRGGKWLPVTRPTPEAGGRRKEARRLRFVCDDSLQQPHRRRLSSISAIRCTP